MSTAVASSLRWRVHWATCELDARGEIDEHAALCLGIAVDAAHTRTVEMVLVDLRDLTAITPAGLELFSGHTATCLAHGIDLGRLICGHQRL